MGLFRKLRQGFRSLRFWLPVIWRDRHWDYVWLLEIIEHKIEGMEAHMLEHAIRSDYREIAAEMERARLLCLRLISGHYDSVAHSDWEKAWWPIGFSWHIDARSGMTSQRVAEQDRPAEKALVRAGMMAFHNEHAALVELCQILMEMERWWD